MKIKGQLVLDYTLFYGFPPPQDRLSLIKHIPKKILLAEIAGLNYRLKPKQSLQIDNSFTTQVKELKYFTQVEDFFNQCITIYNRYVTKDSYPLIFTRQACLYALEEISNNSDFDVSPTFQMARLKNWEAIFKYILSVNYTITQIKDEEGIPSLETLNPKMVPLNEQILETDILWTLYRGSLTMDFFQNHNVLGTFFKQYFKDSYNLTPNEFTLRIVELFWTNNKTDSTHDFHYSVSKMNSLLFETLSTRIDNKKIERLIGIKKSPFIKIDEDVFVLADNTLLLEKGCNQMINDFWFDCLKHTQIQISYYKGEFGRFFENYISNILRNSLTGHKHCKYKSLKELTYKEDGKEKELADIYARYNNKIFIAEIKGGILNDDAKYGGDFLSLYNKDRNAFFDKFGMGQLVDSIRKLPIYAQNFDSSFPIKNAYSVYPSIIVYDRALQTPLMAEVFNKRFQELIGNISASKMRIKPLSIMHVSDIERLQVSLTKSHKVLWDTLQVNTNDKFIPPFYYSLNKRRVVREYPETVQRLFRNLIERFNKQYNYIEIKL